MKKMIDRRGYVEIGYVYTYLISALLLASIISVSMNLSMQTEESSVEMLLQDVANRLAIGIEKAILQMRLDSESRGEINISFQSEIQGRYTILEYNITATNATVYINTTKVKVRSTINNPGTVNVNGTIIGYIIARESITGCTNTIRISYSSKDNGIVVKA